MNVNVDGLVYNLEEHPMILMGKSMVSGFQIFPGTNPLM